MREPALLSLASTVRRDLIAAVVREELEARRTAGENETRDDSAGAISLHVRKLIETYLQGGIRRVINGTGVILSTNLGRAPLARDAAQTLAAALQSYCNLEFDLGAGERGERTAELSHLLKLLTGSPSTIVVNNCAAALMLAIQALAPGKEVIVSRGELIEIGGSFRLPDVIAASGGILREIGTTNRTRLSDYREAIGPNTGLILKCHRSNYQIVGFTEEAQPEPLAALAAESGIQFVYDLGGGCFVDLAKYDLAVEPTVEATIAAGVDLVLFSGDKLLGGPQAGIIAGKTQHVEKLRRHPTYRTLRADKIVLALLETVVRQYFMVQGPDSLPVFVMSGLKQSDLQERVNLFIDTILRSGQLGGHLTVEGCEMSSTIGGGSLPGQVLPSYGIAIGGQSESRLAKFMRAFDPPIITTVSDGRVLIDFRTIMEGDEGDLARALITYAQTAGGQNGKAKGL